MGKGADLRAGTQAVALQTKKGETSMTIHQNHSLARMGT